MDLISQLQDHTNHIACLLFDTVGSLQRDAQPAPLPGKELPQQSQSQSQGGKGPLAGNALATTTAAAAPSGPAGTPPTAPGVPNQQGQAAGPGDTSGVPPGGDAAPAAAPPEYNMAEDVQARAQALVKALKLFDDMVSALPNEVDVSEGEILEKIRKVQEENEEVGEQLAAELEAVADEKRRVGRLFAEVASKTLN